MDEHALDLLEFPRIRRELEGLCASLDGARLLATQAFLTDRGALDQTLDLVEEFRTILESGSGEAAYDFPEIGQAVSRLGIEGMQLEGEELAALGRWILSGLKLKRTIQNGATSGVLWRAANGVADLSAVSRRIFRVVDHDGSVREKQIPELAAIRERIRRHREEADRSVRALLEHPDTRGYWQTTTPTVRDGRVVLPLKAQYKGRIPGIVHEASSSGSTLFVEPIEIVERNNAVVEDENRYRLEVRRVLRELTAEVSRRAEDLRRFVAEVAALDTWRARARYAVAHDCRRAGHDPDRVDLRAARHPLLQGGAIPVALVLGGEERVLIITGPNTGGKTVSLKTVGILALMNQFGIPIPAAEGSVLPLFDSIHADIGDEQSIQQSLSTFSAHVKNLAAIVRDAGPRSLVLLDELGAGTDPQEGVALAMALLDHFLARGCLVMVSTHHGILKNYGATRPGAQNASMGFDPQTLAPTYRVLMGVPGESHALQIARRSGMPENVLRSAFSYLDEERTDISQLVAHLAERQQKLTAAEEEARAREGELREKRRRTDERELALKEKELELRRHGLRELRDFISRARREWDELRRRTGSSAGADFAALAATAQERIEFEEALVEEERESLVPPPSFEVRPGMEVVIARTGRRGRVLRPDRGRRWIIETETVRLSLPPGELAPAPADAGREATAPAVSFSAAGAAEPPVLELHIRGMRLDEAMSLVEKQLDRAILHGLREFAIVHGKGEGILRTAVHRYLKSLPAVEGFRFSAPEEGGFGRTIVTLKG